MIRFSVGDGDNGQAVANFKHIFRLLHLFLVQGEILSLHRIKTTVVSRESVEDKAQPQLSQFAREMRMIW